MRMMEDCTHQKIREKKRIFIGQTALLNDEKN